MSEPEIFVSVDIETDGPCPGLNSMLALGAVAYDGQENQLGTWYSTLAPLMDCARDPGTMEWWATQPEAWAEVSGSRNRARDMIPDFGYWCEALRGTPVAVSWPAVFDFAYVNYYLHRFTSQNPLGYAALDIRSYASGIAGCTRYSQLSEQQVHELAGPVDTTDLRPHFALDDAIGQGRLFLGLRRRALMRAAGRMSTA
jgi:3'-5' exoribonuclease Rv2179c-like domain